MKVIGFVGPSGSGKSHRALIVAHDYDVDVIIDDGLAIKGSRIIAGMSAKKQPTRIGAIKTAIFANPTHADDVKAAIGQENVRTLLILGTSVNMIKEIARRLALPQPDLFVHIHEVASAKEIRQAHSIRQNHGTHVVPAPTLAVKPKFSGLMIEPFRLFFHRPILTNKPATPMHLDQTIVRPTFNYLGRFYISTPVFKEIITHSIAKSSLPVKLRRVDIDNFPEGITLTLEIAVLYGVESIPQLAMVVQQLVFEDIDYMTAMHVIAINVLVKSFYFQ